MTFHSLVFLHLQDLEDVWEFQECVERTPAVYLLYQNRRRPSQEPCMENENDDDIAGLSCCRAGGGRKNPFT
jgi:hypothetical protein